MRVLKSLYSTCILIGMTVSGLAQQANVTEKEITMPTYPFSDPNPVASAVNEYPNMYPYYRFDGFTDKAVDKKWKVVELENDYIRVLIFPEIGGKVWTAIEKKTGEPFLYYNHVVKFRDVAMRGAWTSGGIEFNYGIIGHTPNCSTPVDYITRTNADGSVSCIIGTLDLVTRTNWHVEINLPTDKAFFTTRSFWHNGNAIPQPYYHWSNAAIPSAGNLEFVTPGNSYIGHDGETGNWSKQPGNGKDLSFYDQNDFGEYKSYHVAGKHAHFFGGYWHDKNRGMAHYAAKDEKPGKKLFIWGLSEQGMIWQHILSDRDGQYVEVQSGRLLNQNVERSSYTPFKQISFMPYATQGWVEYWFPVLQTRGITAANPLGTLHVAKLKGKVDLYFSAVSKIADTMVVYGNDKVLYKKWLQLNPLDVFSDAVMVNDSSLTIAVSIGGNKLLYSEQQQSDTLSRPMTAPPHLEENAYHLYRVGADRLAQRFYAEAGTLLQKALLKDASLVPAWTCLAELKYYELKYDSAAHYARKALSLDTYDGAANYFFGVASLQLNKLQDAEDAFSMAALTVTYQGAAYTMLAAIELRKKQNEGALAYADKALDLNRKNISALEIKMVAYRYLKMPTLAYALADSLLGLDPLHHFAVYEKYLLDSTQTPYTSFSSRLRNEMPEQTILEIAICYHALGCVDEAATLFQKLPQNAEAIYWLAWLSRHPNKNTVQLLQTADSIAAHLVFPFRQESAAVLQWAQAQTGSWKSNYYLALIYRAHNNPNAVELLEECGQKPDFSPFYITRMQYVKADSARRLQHIQQAINYDPSNWRYQKLLAEYFMERQQYAKAMEITSAYTRKHPGDYKMGMLHVRTLLLNGQYRKADRALSELTILPYEGATDGHELYREAKMMQAVQLMRQKQFKKALLLIEQSKAWPANLGAGKPYDSSTDVQLPDYLLALCYQGLGQDMEYKLALKRIEDLPVGYTSKPGSSLVKAWVVDKQNPGDKDAGHNFLNTQLKSNPSDKKIRWAVNTYAKIPDPVLLPYEKDADMRIMEALVGF